MFREIFGKFMPKDIPPAEIIDDEEKRKRENDRPEIRIPAIPPEEPEMPQDAPDEPPKPGSTVIKIDL